MWAAWIISTYICLSKLLEPLACQSIARTAWGLFDPHQKSNEKLCVSYSHIVGGMRKTTLF